MNLLEKSVGGILILSVVFGAGVFTGRVNSKPRIVYKETETRQEGLSRFEISNPEVHKTVQVLPTKTRRVIIIRAPDGTITTDTTDVASEGSRENTEAKADSVKGETKTLIVTKEVIKWHPSEAPRWAVEALVSVDTNIHGTYGAAVSYRVLGPITVGLWGLSSKVGGVSLGVTF